MEEVVDTRPNRFKRAVAIASGVIAVTGVVGLCSRAPEIADSTYGRQEAKSLLEQNDFHNPRLESVEKGFSAMKVCGYEDQVMYKFNVPTSHGGIDVAVCRGLGQTSTVEILAYEPQ